MRRNAIIAVGTVAFAAAFAAAVAVMLSSRLQKQLDEERTPVPLMDASAYESMVVPPFTLTDQSGRTVTDDALRWEGFTIVDFMFSHCQLACPIMSGNMYRLTQMLEGRPVRFKSISVDPLRDTPETLSAYASRLGADTDRWSFLTTDNPADVENIVKSLNFQLIDDPSEENVILLPDGSRMNNIIHPTRFLVFNPEGKVVGLYAGNNSADVDRLAVDLKRAIEVRERR